MFGSDRAQTFSDVFIFLQPVLRICVPVPLYHCFGSVGGGIIMAVHGATVVYPSAGYNGAANLAAMDSERYQTPTLHG